MSSIEHIITPEQILDQYVNFTCEVSEFEMKIVVTREDAILAINEYYKKKTNESKN